MGKTLSLEDVRSRLARLGKGPVDVARELKVPTDIVQGVLSGRLKGNRGAAYKVAVTLGLRESAGLPSDMPIAEALRAAG